MISISTAWNHRPGIDARTLLSEIKAAGFDTIELGYKITVPQLREIIPLLGEYGLKVSSVHNYCPLPDDSVTTRHPSNHYRLSGIDEAERKLAVKWTNQAVDTAVATKAKVVVIHAGTVDMPEQFAESLIKSYKEKGEGLDILVGMKDKFLSARAKAKKPFWEALMKSLKEVMDYAEQKNIKIGLETRYYPTEIPNMEEIGEILEKFGKQGMGYWHDVGHAETNERLQIYGHVKCLTRYQDKIIGWHLHGTRILKDHQAPLAGDLDWAKITPFIKPHHIKVIESHSTASVKDLQEAIQFFKELDKKA